MAPGGPSRAALAGVRPLRVVLLAALACPPAASAAAAAAAQFRVAGELELAPADPVAFVAGLGAGGPWGATLGPAIAAAAGGVLPGGAVEASLEANPRLSSRLQEISAEAPWALARPAPALQLSYAAAAAPAVARLAAQALHAAALGVLAAGLTQALEGANATGLPSSHGVYAHSVSVLAYDVFGAMGGSTNLTVTRPDGVVELHEAAPARWNAWHPKACGTGGREPWRCACPQPQGPPDPAAIGPLLPAVPADGGTSASPRLGDACGTAGVPPAPRGLGAVLLARRGGCEFLTKLLAAEIAGYCGLVVANSKAGAPHPRYGLKELPDMSAEPAGDDAEVALPAWIVSRRSGEDLLSIAATGTVRVDARDVIRKAPLGQSQEDELGVRDHHVE